MSPNLTALIAQFLTPDMVARIAAALGIDRSLAQKAIDAAVPALLARLAGQASKPEGARQISNVLAQQGSDTLADFKKAVDARKGFGENGWNLCSALLGGNIMNGLSAAIANFAGIGEGASRSLLSALGSVVTGVLGQQQRSAGLDASGLAALLAAQKDQFATAIPSGLASQLSGAGLLEAVNEGARTSAAAASATMGRITDSAERTMTRAAAPATRSDAMAQLPFFLIALVALAALAWYFLSSRSAEEVAEQIRAPAKQAAEQTRATVTQATEQARVTTGLATADITVGGVDLAKRVNASVGNLTAALSGITDAASAQAALPRIQEAAAEFDKVKTLAAQLPAERKRTLAMLIAGIAPTINQLCDKVLATPGVGPVAKPAIDEVRMRLDTLTRA